MKYLITAALFTLCQWVFGQDAIEAIIVEEYFSTEDFTLIDANWQGEKQVKTYRIFIDLAEGCHLQAVFGNEDHDWIIGSTGLIYNHDYRGWESGTKINSKKFDDGALILDSYLTMNTISNSHSGIPKSYDKDGSYLDRFATESTDPDYLAFKEADLKQEMPIHKVDGMFAEWPKNVQYVGFEGQLEALLKDHCARGEMRIDNGLMAVIGGVKGPTEENTVYIGQITTDGELFFELNLQVGLVDGSNQQFVAKNPKRGEIQIEALNRIANR